MQAATSLSDRAAAAVLIVVLKALGHSVDGAVVMESGVIDGLQPERGYVDIER